MGKKIFYSIGLGFFVILICFAVLGITRSYKLQSLVHAGFPATPESMLTFYGGVPEEENAWVLLEGLDKKIIYAEEHYGNLPIAGNAESRGHVGNWSPEMLIAAENFVDSNIQQIENVHEALKRPYLRIPNLVTNKGYLDPMHTVDGMILAREITRLLLVEANLVLYEQEYELPLRNIKSILTLSNLIAQQPTAVASLTKFGIDGMVFEFISDFLSYDDIPNSVLTELSHTLWQHEKNYDGEVSMGMYMLENQLWEYKGNFFAGVLEEFYEIAFFPEEYFDFILYESSSIHYSFYQRYIEIFIIHNALMQFHNKSPQTYEERHQIFDILSARYALFRPRGINPLWSTLNERGYFSYANNLCEQRFFRLLVAIKQHCLKYGVPPASLEALAGTTIEEIPKAPFDTAKWEYEVNDGNYSLTFDYSNLKVNFFLYHKVLSYPSLPDEDCD